MLWYIFKHRYSQLEKWRFLLTPQIHTNLVQTEKTEGYIKIIVICYDEVNREMEDDNGAYKEDEERPETTRTSDFPVGFSVVTAGLGGFTAGMAYNFNEARIEENTLDSIYEIKKEVQAYKVGEVTENEYNQLKKQIQAHNQKYKDESVEISINEIKEKKKSQAERAEALTKVEEELDQVSSYETLSDINQVLSGTAVILGATATVLWGKLTADQIKRWYNE